MNKKPKESDIIAIRDSVLRARIQALVNSSKGKIKIAHIVRAAIEEKLDQVDRTGSFTIEVNGLAEPSPAARYVRDAPADARARSPVTYTRKPRAKTKGPAATT